MFRPEVERRRDFRKVLEELMQKSKELAREMVGIDEAVLDYIRAEWPRAYERSEGNPIVQVGKYFVILAKPVEGATMLEGAGRRGYPFFLAGEETARMVAFFESEQALREVLEALKTGDYVLLVSTRRPPLPKPINVNAAVRLAEVL